jgi:hypothetical protein
MTPYTFHFVPPAPGIRPSASPVEIPRRQARPLISRPMRSHLHSPSPHMRSPPTPSRLPSCSPHLRLRLRSPCPRLPRTCWHHTPAPPFTQPAHASATHALTLSFTQPVPAFATHALAPHMPAPPFTQPVGTRVRHTCARAFIYAAPRACASVYAAHARAFVYAAPAHVPASIHTAPARAFPMDSFFLSHLT